MTKNSKLLFFISLLVFMSADAQKDKMNTPKILPDWKKNTFDYAQQIVPSKIKNDNTGELISVTLKKAYLAIADNDPVVLAVCTVENGNKKTSSYAGYEENIEP